MIFLDTCAIIYWIEITEPYYSKFSKKLKMLRHEHGELDFAISQLSLLECRIKPLRENNTELLHRYQQFFNAQNLIQIPLHFHIIEIATKLRAYHHLSTPDALQAASALSLQENTFFLTNDSAFKKIEGLQTILIHV